MTTSVVGLVEMSNLEPLHIGGGVFIPSDRVPPPVPALKPIESPDQFWDILDEQRARDRAQIAARTEARQKAPARQAEVLAQRRDAHALAETRSYLAAMRATLENLQPPAGTREQLLVRALVTTLDAFTAARVPAEERLEVRP